MQWSPQQDQALSAVARWIEYPDQPIFRLFGYAGTGKTTLAKHLAEGVDGGVAFGAFTGKAALRLQEKGCNGARTIHSMIYISSVAAQAKLRRLEAELAELIHSIQEDYGDDQSSFERALEEHRGVKELRRKVEEADKDAAQPMFTLNKESDIASCDLIVID